MKRRASCSVVGSKVKAGSRTAFWYKKRIVMRFCSKEVPGSLFKLARSRMLAKATFTPDEIRRHLMLNGASDLGEVSDITKNHWIVADRVMRETIKELVVAGEISQIKRGVWARKGAIAASV